MSHAMREMYVKGRIIVQRERVREKKEIERWSIQSQNHVLSFLPVRLPPLNIDSSTHPFPFLFLNFSSVILIPTVILSPIYDNSMSQNFPKQVASFPQPNYLLPSSLTAHHHLHHAPASPPSHPAPPHPLPSAFYSPLHH